LSVLFLIVSGLGLFTAVVCVGAYHVVTKRELRQAGFDSPLSNFAAASMDALEALAELDEIRRESRDFCRSRLAGFFESLRPEKPRGTPNEEERALRELSGIVDEALDVFEKSHPVHSDILVNMLCSELDEVPNALRNIVFRNFRTTLIRVCVKKAKSATGDEWRDLGKDSEFCYDNLRLPRDLLVRYQEYSKDRASNYD